jgi:hypothetical protein
MDVLGVILGHDMSFALVSSAELLGVMETERFFRQKWYNLHCIDLSPGRHPSGYQYVDAEDSRAFLTMIRREWGAALMLWRSRIRVGRRNFGISLGS